MKITSRDAHESSMLTCNYYLKIVSFCTCLQNLVTITPCCTKFSRFCHSSQNIVLLYKDFKILPKSYVHVMHNTRQDIEEERTLESYTFYQTQGSLFSLYITSLVPTFRHASLPTFIWNFITWNIYWKKNVMKHKCEFNISKQFQSIVCLIFD